jgi:hypothetical protein
MLRTQSPAPCPSNRKPSLEPMPSPASGFSTTLRSSPPSAGLRDRLLSELEAVDAGEHLLQWAKKTLPLKNTLVEADARVIEAAFQKRLEAAVPSEATSAGSETPTAAGSALSGEPFAPHLPNPLNGVQIETGSRLAIPKESRKRSKAHLRFVSGQPCLVCKRTPSDAHHLKFAQPRALGRKVSDEFTVPLCRGHHRDFASERQRKGLVG